MFGGFKFTKFNMHVFDSEGELMEDLSQDPLIPGRMKSFIISKKKVYAVGYNRVKGKWDWGGTVFDGEKWSLL